MRSCLSDDARGHTVVDLGERGERLLRPAVAGQQQRRAELAPPARMLRRDESSFGVAHRVERAVEIAAGESAHRQPTGEVHAIVLRQRRVVPHRRRRPARWRRDRRRAWRLRRTTAAAATVAPRSAAAVANRVASYGITADEGQSTGAQEHLGVDFTADFEAPQRQSGDVLAPPRAVALELVGQLALDARGCAAPSSGSE